MHSLRRAVAPIELTLMRQIDETLFQRRQCRQEDHIPIKTDRELWLKKTIPRGLSEDLDDDGVTRLYLEVACCIDCGSLLAWHQRLSEAEVRSADIIY